MANCQHCGKMLDFDRMQCRFCGGWTAVDKEIGALGAVSKKSTVMLSDVDAVSVERISIGGVWDKAWGGGLVPTSTTLMGGSPGAGKALAVDTPISTPFGWTTMGELKINDLVFDEQGQPCRVLAKSKIMSNRHCYAVDFFEGETIIADAEHLWFTSSVSDRVHSVPGRLRTTLQIADHLQQPSGQWNHSIVRTKPLALSEKVLPIAPYTLGVWLGDGSSAANEFTGCDDEIAERVNADGYPTTKRSGPTARYPNRSPVWTIHGLRAQLVSAGLLHNKHIPKEYLRASISQRLELIRGLMDTDGGCNKFGHCTFDTTSVALRDGMSELLATMGIKSNFTELEAKIAGRSYGAYWRFNFKTDVRVFNLQRKTSRQSPPGKGASTRRRTIVAVRSVPSVPVCCIAVSSPSHLYLAGRGMIPTHNTTGLLQIASAVAGITKRTSYYFSAEQAPGELKMTVDRLNLPNVSRIRVIREFGVGAEIEEGLLKEDPPGMFVLDSVSALCGQDKQAALEVTKRYKKMSVKWGAPAILICQMTKENDYAGLNSLQHEVDTLMTVGRLDSERDIMTCLLGQYPKLDRKKLHKLIDEGKFEQLLNDLRVVTPWKSRYGATGQDFPLAMTPHGLLPLPELEVILGQGSKAFDRPVEKRRPTTIIPPASSEANVIGDSLHPSGPDEIVVNGQKLKRVKPKKKKKGWFGDAPAGAGDAPARAAAVEGEALKKKRPPLPRTKEGKRAAIERRKVKGKKVKEARA